jgi:osmoprotectant transport system ATP-binding protein
MSGCAIEFRDISYRLPSGRLLLDHINLKLEPGTTTALLGRSGSGKTTLLRMVNRMAEPTGGEILLEGRRLRTQDPVTLRRSIGYVIQETGLFPHINVERNVSLVPELKGESRAAIVGRTTDLLHLVGLNPVQFGKRMPHELSGGQRQRVGLARALAAEQKILLMDEPFGALDPLTRAEMQDVLLDLMAKIPKTVLLVTHDLDEALYLASQVVLLEQGRVVATLPSADFMQSEIPEVQEYVQAVRRGEQLQQDLHAHLTQTRAARAEEKSADEGAHP